MKYPQGGGLTAGRRKFRERLRLQAAQDFARDVDNAVIAKRLRVGVRSVQRWRKAWSVGGEQGLRSKGPAQGFALVELAGDLAPIVRIGQGAGGRRCAAGPVLLERGGEGVLSPGRGQLATSSKVCDTTTTPTPPCDRSSATTTGC
ncbi:helix-turn-helix domain-containing protein [Nocardia terpenica]|nr:helix-turn-helix domain-containing protein [Nocardia terpenica]